MNGRLEYRNGVVKCMDNVEGYFGMVVVCWRINGDEDKSSVQRWVCLLHRCSSTCPLIYFWQLSWTQFIIISYPLPTASSFLHRTSIIVLPFHHLWILPTLSDYTFSLSFSSSTTHLLTNICTNFLYTYP